MNWEPIKKTFVQDDGSLDEIVLAATAFIIAALVLEFRTYWTPATGTPPFSLKDFGEGVAACAVGFGAWWRLRDWSKQPRQDKDHDKDRPAQP